MARLAEDGCLLAPEAVNKFRLSNSTDPVSSDYIPLTSGPTTTNACLMANRHLDSAEDEKGHGLVTIPTSPSNQSLLATTNSPTTTNGCLMANRHLGFAEKGHGLVAIPASSLKETTTNQSLFAPMGSMDETRLATALSAESRPAEECRVLWVLT
jgi:hypothetical protein